MSNLINLLKDLGGDAGVAAEFERDPDGVSRRYGVNDEERQAMTSGDVDSIRRLSGIDKLHLTHSTVKVYD